MAYDDIVIGSGLTALATVIGLEPKRKVLVLAGPEDGKLSFYDKAGLVPRSFHGYGGLGNYWHGVITSSARAPYASNLSADFGALFRYFYPRSEVERRVGTTSIFIPRRPIRPAIEWPKLVAQRGANLEFTHTSAERFELCSGGVAVRSSNHEHKATRLWIAAGTLHTPNLLAQSVCSSLKRAFVSDHVICYAGQLERRKYPHIAAPDIDRTPDGFWLNTFLDDDLSAMYTLKPARLSYRKLDYGIEQRAAFGLPTGSAVAKIARSSSLGLIAEALFNRYGLFPNSSTLNVYAQVLVKDAFLQGQEDAPLELIQSNVDKAIADLSPPWSELLRTRRPDLFLRGVHLHHSVNLDELSAQGICDDKMPVRIVDASVLNDIGAEHHTFYTMSRAYRLAREASA